MPSNETACFSFGVLALEHSSFLARIALGKSCVLIRLLILVVQNNGSMSICETVSGFFQIVQTMSG